MATGIQGLRGWIMTATVAGAILIGATGPALAQDISVNVTISEMQGVSHVVMPQTRAFPINGWVNPIQVEEVRANVKIIEQTATTTLEVRLRNAGSRQTEAVILLPVPEGAAVSSFAFDGQSAEPTAQVLRRDEARRLYDQIVNQVRDPALLEFAGYNLIRSSVFPVAAGGEQRVRLAYEHLLAADGPRVDYVLPRSESIGERCPWHITATIQAKSPISTVYSPTHDLVTERKSETQLTVKLSESAVLAPGPFRLSYLMERDNGVTASIYAYPDPKVGGGYFLLMAGLPVSHQDGAGAAKVKREVTVVLDRSGSMAGAKMDQVKVAALQVIEGLEDGETFNIIDYSTAVSSFAPAAVKRTAATAMEARKYLDAIRPAGGTNIHDALVEALRQAPTAGSLPITLFLTDGLPTVGPTSEVAIREMVEKGNAHGRRVFTFGVGSDVNVPLLDRLAEMTRGTSTYVLPGEDVELSVARVFKQLYGPVLSDLAIQTVDAAGEVSTRLVRELVPTPLPDLFEGDQLILMGQYQGEGPIGFRLSGKFRGQAKTYRFDFDLKGATTRNAFVPRLWASRRIAYLVDQIRQAGAAAGAGPQPVGTSLLDDPRYRELAEEILRLSTEFGILSEYTAFLATDGTNLGNWEELREACNSQLDHKAVRTRTGEGAVNQALNMTSSKAQTTLKYSNEFVNDQLKKVEITGVQQVCDRAFFKRGDQWIDARLVSSKAVLTAERTVTFGSTEYRQILDAMIAKGQQGLMSLPGQIMIEYEGQTILIANDGK